MKRFHSSQFKIFLCVSVVVSRHMLPSIRRGADGLNNPQELDSDRQPRILRQKPSFTATVTGNSREQRFILNLVSHDFQLLMSAPQKD